MDVHITYETLFDILRKERSLDELQHLDSQFWSHVVSYLQERTNFMAKTSLTEQEKTRVQLHNIKRIIREIYQHRQRKIANLALNTARTQSESFVDTRHLLDDEKNLFHDLVSKLTTHRQEVLLQIQNNSLPLGMSASPRQENDLKINSEENTQEEKNKSTTGLQSDCKESESEEHLENKNESELESGLQKESDAQASSQLHQSQEEILVKFISSVPKFLGKDKEIFGPFEEGIIVFLPVTIVNILLKKGKVKKVLSD